MLLRDPLTSWLGHLRNWLDGPADWALGFLLVGSIVAGIVLWRLYVYSWMPRFRRQQSRGEAEMLLGFVMFLYGLLVRTLSRPGTNLAMILTIVSSLGGVLFIAGIIAWSIGRSTAMKL